MEYYTAGFGPCALNAQQVVMNMYLDELGNPHYSTSAQCGAFALLLESALAINGIHSNWITISPANNPEPDTNPVKMVIKNWCFIGNTGCPSGTPSYPSEPYWKYQLTLNIGDYMVPAPTGGYGDLTNLQGIPGQGGSGLTSPPFTPVEKVFDLHFIVQVPWLDGSSAGGDQYYDPSYGVTYSSSVGFETQAVVGFAYRFPLVDGPGTYHVFTPILGSPNIIFTPVPSRSM
jgi:hypothetical protein